MNIFSGTNSIKEALVTFKNTVFSQNIIDGDSIAKYEDSFKSYLKTPGTVYSFAAGRMALYSSLKAMSIGKGDEVIIPSFTCIVVPNAIIYTGAKPVYCDISLSDYNIDVNEVEKYITPNTKAIYAQHSFGKMCNIIQILELAKRHNLYVIEDAALSLGSKINNQQAGTFGDIGYFSTDRSKIINTGQGGLLCVNNKKLIAAVNNEYERVSKLPIKFAKSLSITFVLNFILQNPFLYRMGKYIYVILMRLKLITYISDDMCIELPKGRYPYPARLPNILANIGISQLESIESNLSHRRKNATYYNSILKIYSDKELKCEDNIFLRYSFMVKNRSFWENKFSNLIDLSVWFKTIAAGRDSEFEKIHYTEGSNLVSEFATKHIFNLPTHKNIKPHLLEKYLKELKESGDILPQNINIKDEN